MIEIRDFADVDDMREAIEAFERRQTTCGVNIGDPFFDRRVLYLDSFPCEEIRVRRILQRWRERATVAASTVSGRRLYADTIQIVRWDGQAMPPHRDDRHPDGSAHRTPWRQWAGIIYLNSGYAGGELYFPEVGETYAPVAGALALFEACLLHGVAASNGGPRYTSPSWFTDECARADRTFAER